MRTTRIQRGLAALTIVAALTLAFFNGAEGRFYLDDSKVIVDNARVRHVVPHSLIEWVGPRALVDLTFALNYAAGALEPAGYHAVNLMLHAATALLLFGLLRGCLLLPVMPVRVRAAALPLATAATVLWAVHPLAGSAVLYVCQRYELMAAAFTVLTLYALLRASGSAASRRWPLVAVAACLAGMASKETMAVTPLLALFFDRAVLSPSWRAVWRARGGLHAALMGTCGYLLVPLVAPSLAAGVHDYEPAGVSGAYLIAQLRVIAHYLRLAVWPHPLCLDYGWTAAPESFGGVGSILLTLAAAGTTAALTAAGRRSGFLGVCFFLLLAPTSSAFPHPDIAFDHRMYLPLAALTVALCLGLHAAIGAVADSPAGLRLFGTAVAAVALALGLATTARNRVFADPERMWDSVLAVSPCNLRAAVCLSGDLYARHRDEEAVTVARRALACVPPISAPPGPDPRRIVDTSQLLNNLGLALARQSRTNEALTAFAQSVSMAPGNTRAHLNYGAVALAAGDTNTALREVDIAFRLAPRDAGVMRSAADLLALTGRPQAAVALYKQVLALSPDGSTVRTRLAWLLATCPDPAVRDGATALRLAKDMAAERAALDGDALEAIAAAMAEAGDTATAARIQNDVATTFGVTPERQARLTVYRAGTAWRDPRLATVPATLGGDRTP